MKGALLLSKELLLSTSVQMRSDKTYPLVMAVDLLSDVLISVLEY